MALSKLLLGATYSSSQYLGALMVCAGIFIVLSPSQNSSHGDSGESSASGNGHSQILWAGVMMVSCVPTVLSSVYKEMALQGKDIDVIYLNGWVATFQFMLCIPLAYPSAFATSLPIDELWPNIYDGLWCFLGYSSTHLDGSVDDCSTAPIFVSIYMFFNLSYNVLIILILKHGSTNIMFMGSTALVPLTNALFACPFIPGHTPMKPADFVGLGVIMAGITVYRFVQRLPCKFLDGGPVDSDDEDEAADEDLASGGGAAKEGTSKRKDGLYIGLNSIAAETVQPLLETRVILARAQRARMNRLPERPHTRSPYLSRLGIAPSPRVGASPRFSPGTRTPPQRGYNPLRPNPKQRVDGKRQASLA